MKMKKKYLFSDNSQTQQVTAGRYPTKHTFQFQIFNFCIVNVVMDGNMFATFPKMFLYLTPLL